jgi:ABC-type transport system involved in Fe-S cluster assembly fused permease/ATPase subunit
MDQGALVIFTPSGKRGRFAVGTPVLTAARQLGVDLDSVCGGRGICSKCQVSPGVGAFPKHGVEVAADALSNAEAVKIFSAEDVETTRYASAVAAYQRSLNQAQGSLTILNSTQQVVIFATLLGVLLLAAYDVAAGNSTLGRFVLLNTITVQTFAPLGFLGTIWSMLNTAFTDLANLLQLLRQEPDVMDAPGAVDLKLRWTSARDGRATSSRAEPPKPGFEADSEAPGPIESEHVATAVASARLAASARPSGASTAKSETSDGGALPSIEFKDVWFAYGARATRAGAAGSIATDKAKPTTAGSGSGSRGTASSASSTVRSVTGKITVTPGSAAKAATSGAGAGKAEDEDDRYVLRGVNFKVEAGSSLAIVGSSGAGKSSIAKLIFRLYDVSRGAIEVGGMDVRKVRVRSLRSQLGMVSQDTTLFNASLAYNIRYGAAGDERVTDADVADAARRAALQPLIDRLPSGLDTVVGERGLQLSGGERQRTAIARVLLRSVPVVVADEFSSALDSVTEAEVSSTMASAASGRTLVVIAHRLSTAMHCDQIIVLDKGVVSEQGTHRELLERRGAYSAMWALQAKEALGEAVLETGEEHEAEDNDDDDDAVRRRAAEPGSADAKATPLAADSVAVTVGSKSE